MVRRLASESRAQDLVEYALLTALVGILGIAAWSAIEARVGQAYTIYDTDTQNLWQPPDPGIAPPAP